MNAAEVSALTFGLEAEYMLATVDDMHPLWHEDLSWPMLETLIGGISCEDLPGSMDDLTLKKPHRRRLPYLIEGFAVRPDLRQTVAIIPKGLEIRTPVCHTVDETLVALAILHARMQHALLGHGLTAVALSHHPLQSRFDAPRNYARDDYWQWECEAMTTYGPDINLGVPREWFPDDAAIADLEAKMNHYSPAMAALFACAPFLEGAPWRYLDTEGRSYRLHKRSYIAPGLLVSARPGGRLRLEYKDLDMSSRLVDFRTAMLLFAAVVLDADLSGRASRQSRIYELGAVARHGLECPGMAARLAGLLKSAAHLAELCGLPPDALASAHARLSSLACPADDLLALYHESGTLQTVLERLTRLAPLSLPNASECSSG